LDFDEKLALLSPTHLAWAKLVKANINQQENGGKDYATIIGRISKGDETSTSKFVTPNTFGVELLDAPIIQVFTLPKDKWKEAQEELRTFFKCNPSPVCQPRPSSTSPVSSPVGVTLSTNVRAATPVIIPNATASQQTLVGGTIDFASPGSFIDPRIAKYTQAMENILLQPTSVRSISMVNILTTVFNKIPNNIAE
jgi:hypothetical protein